MCDIQAIENQMILKSIGKFMIFTQQKKVKFKLYRYDYAARILFYILQYILRYSFLLMESCNNDTLYIDTWTPKCQRPYLLRIMNKKDSGLFGGPELEIETEVHKKQFESKVTCNTQLKMQNCTV